MAGLISSRSPGITPIRTARAFHAHGGLIGLDGRQPIRKNILDAGEHPLSECPVLIGTEGGDFPHFGPFAPIADLSKRLFNLDSELDEILRSQTFSLLTMNVPQGSTSDQKLDAARVAGQTIGTII